MDEQDAGITEYTTATTGFTGILKHRYEDFQVFEIDINGRTAHLTSTSPPEPEPLPDAQLTEESIKELVEAFQEKAGQHNAERLGNLLINILKHHHQQQQGKEQAAPPDNPADAGGAAATSSSAPAEQQQQQEQQKEPEAGPLQVFLLPIKCKTTRKEVHAFLKSDPRLPALETDTVPAASGPEAAEAAAAAAAAIIAEAGSLPQAGQCDPAGGPNKKQGKKAWEADELAAAADNNNKKEEVGALTIIRVRLSEDVAGLRRKRGGSKQQEDAKDGKRGQKRGRGGWKGQDWAGGANKYVKFVLLKENMDTQAALTVVGRMLRLHTHAFGFAGTKDRRGVTTQYATLFKVDASKLSALNPRLRGIKLGNFEFCSGPLQLGQLRGNAFRILMRDVSTHDEQHIAAAVAEVRDKGFINYFGLQRFGTGNVPTHRVGAALLRGEWKAAVGLILESTPHEKEDIKRARELYTTKGDIKGALDAMPTWMVAERAILQTLSKQGPNSYVTALQAVPRTMRSMYMHAWQSWCWNTAASERIRQYGADKVVAGDLVLPPSAAAAAGTAAGEDAAALDEAAAGASADVAVTAAEEGSAAAAEEGDAAAAVGSSAPVESTSAASRLAAVHVVTAEEAEQGTYSITDVVLPLPGLQVKYPQHAAGWDLYCKLAAADNIQLPGMTAAEFAAAKAAAAAATQAAAAANGDSTPATAAAATAAAAAEAGGAGEAPAAATPRQHAVQDFQLSGLSGDYRKVLHVPSGLQHKLVRYTDPNCTDLLPTDLTELKSTEQQSKRAKKREAQQQHHQKNQQQQQQGKGVQGPEQQQRDQGQQPEQQQQQQQQALEQPLHVQPADQAMEVEPGSVGGQEPAAAAAAAADANGSAAAAAASVGAEQAARGGGGGGDNAAGGANCRTNDSSQQQQQQERLGVILEFSLPSSCYATMLIRELTKTSTSKAAHKELSAKQPGGGGGGE